MRLLSDQELDDVLGSGDQVSAITLSTIQVNGTVAANPSNVFSLSAPGIGIPINEGSSNTPCYAAYFHGLAQLPTFSHLRCIAAHTTKPGYDLVSGVDIILLNAFAAGPSSPNGNVDLGRLALANTSTPPPGSTLTMSGVYQSNSAYHAVTITANGLTALTAPVQYIDVNTGQSATWNSGMTAQEHTAFVLAHEAAHMHNISDETQANGYGIYALQQLDQLPAGTCP